MSEKKELSLEELEKVTGGKDMDKHLPSNHGRHISMYEAEGHIGEKVYAVRDMDRNDFFWGTLLDSYEEPTMGGTERAHKILIEGVNDYFFNEFKGSIGCNVKIYGYRYTLFLYR